MSPCRQSFGITFPEPYSDLKHREEDSYLDPLTKKVMAGGQLHWLIRKGDLILSDQPTTAVKAIQFTFQKHDKIKKELPIYMYPEEDIPERFHNSWNGKLPRSLAR